MTSSVVLVSSDGGTEARFAPSANMVCSSLRVRGVEVLDQRQGVEAYAERGKTMGIPLLYPWANRLEDFSYAAAARHVALPRDDPRIPRDPNGLPIHGVMPGLLRWEVVDAGSDRVRARLRWDSPELFELFPFAHEVLLEARAGDGELLIATAVRATSEDPVPVSFGYHPYVKLPGAPRREWQVTLGAFRRLVLDERSIPTGEREPVEQRSFALGEISLDDGFDALAVPAEFSIAARNAGVAVRFDQGFSYAQVYAPAGQEFICFEPMTAATNALTSGDGLHVIAPGEEYRTAFAVAVSGL